MKGVLVPVDPHAKLLESTMKLFEEHLATTHLLSMILPRTLTDKDRNYVFFVRGGAAPPADPQGPENVRASRVAGMAVFGDALLVADDGRHILALTPEDAHVLLTSS